ncbi:MAG: GIY-YIG nuclease family protein [Candidatus Kerfeldbacteria bacterium]|nr:GIY-YIG nuclease family protein [Candidatus Kerfeldbacteria bacterium]
MYYLYVLLGSKKNWHYIGSTDNVERRLLEHNKGKVKSTKPHRPLKIIYTETYSSRTLARKKESFLKKTAKARIELFNQL